MITDLITSKTRIKILQKFFLNPTLKGYLRGLESEFNENSNAIRIELNRLEGANMLKSHVVGNKKYYSANKDYPLFNEISSIVSKTLGVDQIIDNLLKQVGDLKQAFLIGDIAKGLDTDRIDVVLVGNNLDLDFIENKRLKVEELLHKQVKIEVTENYSGDGFLVYEEERS